jgi:transcriptional regulator with XRE-family HTH domain
MDRNQTQAELRALLGALRQVLKARKITYARIARDLGVSEVTVKRWLTGRTCSLETVFRICEKVGISFFDLTALARREEEMDYVLSEEQEKFFAANPALFGALKLLHRGHEPKKVAALWKLSNPALYRALRKLEKLGLLEVLPGERIRMKTAGNIRYSHQGPLARAILRPQIHRFLDHVDSVLRDDDVALHSAELELSEQNISELVEEIHAIGAKYRARAIRDKRVLPAEKLKSSRWLLAFAPYETDWSRYEISR